jgi:hypothetical protein
MTFELVLAPIVIFRPAQILKVFGTVKVVGAIVTFNVSRETQPRESPVNTYFPLFVGLMLMVRQVSQLISLDAFHFTLPPKGRRVIETESPGQTT